MTDYEVYPKFVTYDHQSLPLLGEGHFEFNQDIDTEDHESKEALIAKWEKDGSRFKDVLATANGSSSPSKETQDLINQTVYEFCQWGFDFARYGYHLTWKRTTDYLDLAKGFAALKEDVYTIPPDDRDLLHQHLENIGTLMKGYYPDGNPDEPKKEEEGGRGRKPIVCRTDSG